MTDTARRNVGIDIMAGEESDALVAALRGDNGALSIVELPSIVQVDVEAPLVISRASVERFLGRPWNTKDLNQVVAAYRGHFVEWDEDQIVLDWHDGSGRS